MTYRFLFLLATLSLASLPALAADSEKKGDGSGAWSDIKGGFRKIVKGANKGVKKAAKKIDENLAEDEREEGSGGKKE